MAWSSNLGKVAENGAVRSYTTYYWSVIVSIALSCTIFELFDVKIYDLEILVKGHLRSLPGTVSYSPSIVSMAVSVAVFEIFSAKEWCDLGNRVRFVQGYW